MELSRKWKVGAGLSVALALALACAMPASGIASSASSDSGSSGETVSSTSTITPEADSFGVIDASAWADIYPNEYNTYLENAKNVPYDYQEFLDNGGVDTTSVGLEDVTDFTSDKADYLEEYPEIKTLGKGYGYAKYYTEPAGHTYSLWTVANNGRLGPLADSKGKISCYACKTPQIHYDAEASGDPDYWTRPISEYADYFTENISCANCHVNDDPTQLQVIRQDWIRALGDDVDTVPLQGQVCGQCHCDYSMAPTVEEGSDVPFDSGEPVSPYYGGLDSMTPENALAFYDEYGFSDWTYASTGAQMLAVRHAEFEFCYANGGNYLVDNMGYNCNDCHMPKQTADDGTTYTSHYWQSPLDNEELLEQCNACHGDLKTEITDLQNDIDGRTHLLGLRAEQFVFNFEDVVSVEKDVDGVATKTFDMDTALANGLTEDQVSRLQTIQREACYYWNLAAAENSEGAHNPDFYNQLIDKGNELLDEADEILGVSSVVDSEQADSSATSEPAAAAADSAKSTAGTSSEAASAKAESTAASSSASEAAGSASASSATYADGTYTASSKGIGGDVPVTVTIEGGKIASVEVGDNSETPSLGGKAIETLPAEIVAANGTDGVDAYSGASVTSKAIFTAVEDCLSQASA